MENAKGLFRIVDEMAWTTDNILPARRAATGGRADDFCLLRGFAKMKMCSPDKRQNLDQINAR